jgi:hypothetical protein
MMDKWDYMKVKSFCTKKEIVSILKRLPVSLLAGEPG